jgi:outer membrane cobalamin receptor
MESLDRKVDMSARLFSMILAAGLFAHAAQSSGSETSSPDLTRLTPEQLLEFDVIRAASRHRQVRREAPSATTVVTAAEIRAHGYRTLGDVLRSVPSFYVTYDRNYSYIGVRGFSRPGDYNTRVLVLLDGVRLNENVYDGGYLTDGFPVDLAIVDRIEIVRGPAASVYGNSAFFAVVDLITKRGADLGGEVSLSAGSFGTRAARAAYGRAFENGPDVVASASGLDADGQDLRFPEFESSAMDGLARDQDGERRRSFLVAATFRGLRLFGTHGRRDKDIPSAPYGTLFGDPRTRTRDEMTRWGLSYEGRPTASLGLAARLQNGDYRYRGAYAYDTGLYQDSARGTWWAAETDLSAEVGKRHVLIGGLEWQWNTRQEQRAYYDPASPAVDVRGRSRRWGLYVQDEAQIFSALIADVGVRYDHYDTFGGRASPRAALIWKVSDRQTLKAVYGEAFRAPNEYELRYYAETGPLNPETIRSAEVVAEHAFTHGLRASASLFENRVDNLIALTGDVRDLRFENRGRTRSRGVELALERTGSDFRGRASYSFQTSRDDVEGGELTNSPRHMAKLALSRALAGERLEIGLDAQYLSARRTLQGRTSPGFAVAHATLNARLVGGLNLTAAVRNLTDRRFADPASEEHVQDVIRQDGRSFRLDLSFRF